MKPNRTKDLFKCRGFLIGFLPYYGCFDQWQILMTNLCKQTHVFWEKNHKTFMTLEEILGQNKIRFGRMLEKYHLGSYIQQSDSLMIEFPGDKPDSLIKEFIDKTHNINLNSFDAILFDCSNLKDTNGSFIITKWISTIFDDKTAVAPALHFGGIGDRDKSASVALQEVSAGIGNIIEKHWKIDFETIFFCFNSIKFYQVDLFLQMFNNCTIKFNNGQFHMCPCQFAFTFQKEITPHNEKTLKIEFEDGTLNLCHKSCPISIIPKNKSIRSLTNKPLTKSHLRFHKPTHPEYTFNTPPFFGNACCSH